MGSKNAAPTLTLVEAFLDPQQMFQLRVLFRVLDFHSNEGRAFFAFLPFRYFGAMLRLVPLTLNSSSNICKLTPTSVSAVFSKLLLPNFFK